MTPEDIRQLFESAPGVYAGDLSDGDVDLSATETARRTASLAQVLLAVQQYWLMSPSDMDLAAEILGDGSRDASWRRPIGQSGLLGFFLGILAVRGLRQSLKIHALRLVGNACADQDENRARVVAGNHLGHLASLLDDDATLAFVIPVLYNICVDYEPAQLQACQASLSRALVSIASGPRLAQCRAFLNILCKTLGLLIAQEAEVSLADPATPTYLLQLAVRPDVNVDVEEFSILASVALAYLGHEPFQEELIRRMAVPALLAVFDSFTQYDVAQMDPDDADEYRSLGNRFMHVIADTVALPSFPTYYPLHSRVVQTLQSWVANSYTDVFLKTTACLALGNLARSDQSSIYFVHDAKVHLPLIQLLTSTQSYPASRHLSSDAAASNAITPSSQLVYSVLSFLKNLAIPLVNRPVLGTLLEAPTAVLPHMWATTDTQPQVQFAAVSLSRLLLALCPENVRRVCVPLSPDLDSPAHDRSNVHVLISLFNRTDAENTKTEAARVVVALCRVLHTASDPDAVLPKDWDPADALSAYDVGGGGIDGGISGGGDAQPSPSSILSALGLSADANDEAALDAYAMTAAQLRRAHFHAAHVDISDCFSYLLMQTRFPVLRSEMLFVAAVLSRSPDGAQVVMRSLQPFEACRALVEAVSGRDLIEGHRLPGGASLLSDDELLTMTDSTGAAVQLPTLSPDQLPSDPAASDLHASSGPGTDGSVTAAAAAGVASASASIDGLGLEPQQVDPAQVASMARVDRENGLVLISELMKNYYNFIAPFRRAVFEQLLQTGGALVISARSEASIGK